MKHFARTAFALGLVLAATPAQAQVAGQYTAAPPLAAGSHLFGGYLDVSSNVVGLMAQLRLSFYPGVDFGFQGGPARVNMDGASRGIIRLGTDVKIAAHHAVPGAMFDLSIGGELGVENGDNYSLVSLGPDLVASTIVRSGSSGGFTPYAGLSLLFTNIDVGVRNETNFSVPLRLGAEFNATPAARIAVEVQLRIADNFRDSAGLNVGVNVPF